MKLKVVPQAKVNELWKNYQLYVEKILRPLKRLNNEFREYDFKKNLEIKNHLCEAAEKLADEPDVVSAFHQLQKRIRNSAIQARWQKNYAMKYGRVSRQPPRL